MKKLGIWMSLGLLPLFAGVDAGALLTEGPDTFPHVRTVMPPLKFSVEGRLRRNRDFWVNIYTQYTTQQGLIHDAKYIDLIYEVVELGGSRTENHFVRARKRHWKEVLLSVHHQQKTPDRLNPEELKVYKMFENIHDPNKFLAAAHRKRLRFQQGQKEHFLQGLKDSGRFLPVMEEIFRKEGLPVELTRLPFVESSFNIRARSKVGASGIWQFMRSTGKLFLNINDAVDERNDPIRATEAAAKLLKGNFESLKQWPLAVTAYNHGRKGMMRAVRKVGSDDLEDVVVGYRSRSFGFASGNFFTELLAAIEVEKNAEKYFGKVDRGGTLPTFEVTVPDYISMKELTRFLTLDTTMIRVLNPGLSDLVYEGKRMIPAGYQLRLPFDGKGDTAGSARVFLAGYNQIPDLYKFRSQRGGSKYGKGKHPRTM